MRVFYLPFLFMIGLTLASSIAQAQNAPPGSCLLPDGRWCWSPKPTAPGAGCMCPTPDGPRYGTTQ